jgi:hypothetical protein
VVTHCGFGGRSLKGLNGDHPTPGRKGGDEWFGSCQLLTGLQFNVINQRNKICLYDNGLASPATRNLLPFGVSAKAAPSLRRANYTLIFSQGANQIANSA